MQLFKIKFFDQVQYLIVSNEEMEDIMKIVKSLEESGLLIKGINEIIIKRCKRPKRRIFWNAGTLAACVLGNAFRTRSNNRR